MDTHAVAESLRSFAEERDWEQFHTPRNLLLALVGEVGELAEVFQWRSDADVTALMADASKRTEVEEELADVAIYLIRLADVLDVDLERSVADKIAANARKYPVDRVRGSAAKYDSYGTATRETGATPFGSDSPE